MIDPKVIDLNGGEHRRCEKRKGRGPVSGDQSQPGERSAEGSDRTGAPREEPDVRLENCERTRCEVWTRVMGYHRPVSAFNAGKRAEHRERQYFSECLAATEERIERVSAANRIEEPRMNTNKEDGSLWIPGC